MKLGILLAALLVSFSASADYFKAGLGYGIGGKEKFTDDTSSSTLQLDNALMTPLVLAYGFEIMGDVHGEVELAYRKTEYDENGVANAEPSALTAGFNVVGNAPMGVVTLTGGAGLLFGSFDSDIVGDDAGTAFGLQLFGGVDFPINETVTLGGELRYMTTVTKADVGSGTDMSYNNTSLIFTAKFGM